MNLVIWPVLILLLLALQMSWFFIFNSVQAPDLLLLFILLYTLDEGKIKGAICGCFLGVLQDVMTYTLLGFHAISRAVAGFAVGMFRGKVFKDNLTFFLILVLIVSIIIKLLYAVVMFFVSPVMMNWGLFLGNSCGYILWNMLCALPVWLLYGQVCSWLDEKKRLYH